MKEIIPVILLLALLVLAIVALPYASKKQGIDYSIPPTISSHTEILTKYKQILGIVTTKDAYITIIEDDDINAFADTESGEIVLTTKLLSVVDIDTLAFIIGHELGHIVLLHNHTYGDSDSAQHELNADMVGMWLAKTAGYGSCGSKKMSNIFLDKGFFGPVGTTHPHPAFRVHLSNLFCNSQ